MAKFLVQKSAPLKGEVKISGSKNAVLPIMAAALLTENKGNVIIRSSYLSYSDACKIIPFALKHDLCIELYTLENTYIYNLNDDERDRVHKVGLDYIEVMDQSYEFLENQKILKILLKK